MKLIILIIGIVLLAAAYNDRVEETVDLVKEAYQEPGVARVAVVAGGLVVAADYDKSIEGIASSIILIIALAMLLNDQTKESKS